MLPGAVSGRPDANTTVQEQMSIAYTLLDGTCVCLMVILESAWPEFRVVSLTMFVFLGDTSGWEVVVCVLHRNNPEGRVKWDTLVNRHQVIPFKMPGLRSYRCSEGQGDVLHLFLNL